MKSEQIVLVTGAGSGIGRAIALRFAKQGHHLILAGRTVSLLQETAKSCPAGSAQVVPTDVASESSVIALFKEIETTYGRLDIAVNNAGTEGHIAPIGQLTLADMDQAYNVNVRGLWHCNQLEIAMMLKQSSGSILNMSSVAGLVGIPGSSIYCATKHAVVGLTKALALEYARHGIRINAVCPGGVETAMLERVYQGDLVKAASFHPAGRNAQPDEIASVVSWLCSQEASFVTGHALAVDGGFTAR